MCVLIPSRRTTFLFKCYSNILYISHHYVIQLLHGHYLRKYYKGMSIIYLITLTSNKINEKITMYQNNDSYTQRVKKA